ncbi:MAG: ABC transporter permease [Deltaproteobacteria bacterium]|nr:ABC transporter permease [Deltaproteobacteria bacterium]
MPRWDRVPTLEKVLSVVIIVAIWQVLAQFFPPRLIPPVERIVLTLYANAQSGDVLHHLGPTVARVYIGFAIALLLGTLTGLVMGLTPHGARLLEYPILFVLGIPSLCWSILGLLWFGLTEAAAVFVIAAIAFPVVVINVHEGVKNVDPALTKMAAVYRVPGRRVVSGLYLPSIFPYILSASRYGLGLSWKIAIIAEMLGMSSGVGFAIHYYYNLLNMEQVLAWTLLFTGVIVFVDQVVLKGIEGVVMRWREA